jgi:hypothetical protein
MRLTIPIGTVLSSLHVSIEPLVSLKLDKVGELFAEPVPFIEATEDISAEDSRIWR